MSIYFNLLDFDTPVL